MQKSTVELEYISWKELHLALVKLAAKVKMSEYKPSIVIGVLKGGLIPARIMADLLAVSELGFIGVRFYKGVSKREAKPEITLPPMPSVSGRKVLLIDDIVDTGRTIQLAVDELYRYGAAEVKSMAIYVKKWSPVIPDYYYKVTDKWVVFPWELVETTTNGYDLESLVGEDREIYKCVLNELLRTFTQSKTGD